MSYSDLIQLYFERSDALQSYWTLYVVIIGGLLAFSSLRAMPDLLTTALLTVLFTMFAYKNLGAIRDTTEQRIAALEAIKQYDASDPSAGDVRRARTLLEPTLNPPDYGGVRVFHIASDLLTLMTLWAMEFRRRRIAREPGAGGGSF
jgi:hypothetical protein